MSADVYLDRILDILSQIRATQMDSICQAGARMAFALNRDGSIDQVKMQAVSPETDFSFDFQDLLLHPKRSK